MKKTIGFIGSGNMGSAIIGGILSAGLVAPQQIIAADLNENSLQKLQNTYHIKTTTDNLSVAQESDILFLSVFKLSYALRNVFNSFCKALI